MKPIYESMKASFDRDIYRLNTNLIAGPAATVWADSDFIATVNDKRPQTVFFKIDADLQVVGKDGKAFASLYDCLSTTSSFIPVIYFDDGAVTDKLINFVYDNCLGDAAVCVPYEKRELLEKTFLNIPIVRGMLDCRSLGTDADWWYAAGQCWKYKAISMLIDAEQCSREVVDILHERIISVWCDAGEDYTRVAFEGVDGVIADDIGGFYAMLDKLPENSSLDNYRIIAHKGLQHNYTEPENSIKAIKKGADYHFDGAEIDIKLTTDNIAFIIHNPTTKAMLAGEPRVIETLSSAELESLERTDFPGYYTDRFDDMLDVMKPYSRYQIYHEFKPAASFYQIEKMTHILGASIERTGTEYISNVINGPEGISYIQRYLPTLPKISSVYEEPKPPQDLAQANETLYRFWNKTKIAPAALLAEDVMVNELFGEVAAIRGFMTIVWTRSWYFKHSLWENDGARSDEGFISGFYSTISDHSERYLYIPKSIALDENNEPVAVMRDGTKNPAENATCYDLGNGNKVWGVRIPLPHGLEYNMFSKVF